MKQEPEAEEEVLCQAKRLGCPVVHADPALAVNRKRGLFRQTFDYKERKGLELSLIHISNPEYRNLKPETGSVLAALLSSEKIRRSVEEDVYKRQL